MNWSRHYTANVLLEPWEKSNHSDETLFRAYDLMMGIRLAKKELRLVRSKIYNGVLQARRIHSLAKESCIFIAKDAKVNWSTKGWGGWDIERKSWKMGGNDEKVGFMKNYTIMMVRNLLELLERKLRNLGSRKWNKRQKNNYKNTNRRNRWTTKHLPNL